MAIQRPYCFHTLIWGTRILQLNASGVPVVNDGLALYHRGKAITGLQDSLADVEDDALPLMVAQIITIEVSHHDSEPLVSIRKH